MKVGTGVKVIYGEGEGEGDALGLGLGFAEAFGVAEGPAEGEGEGLGPGFAEAFGVDVGFGVAEGEGPGVAVEGAGVLSSVAIVGAGDGLGSDDGSGLGVGAGPGFALGFGAAAGEGLGSAGSPEGAGVGRGCSPPNCMRFLASSISSDIAGPWQALKARIRQNSRTQRSFLFIALSKHGTACLSRIFMRKIYINIISPFCPVKRENPHEMRVF